MKKQKFPITMGVELESYSIAVPEYRICRELHFPKRSIVEKGEKFTTDDSIGLEYNSKVFTTIREAFFLLKSGLRKYNQFPEVKGSKDKFSLFPVGGWTDRFAGMHAHFAFGKRKLKFEEAKKLADRLHDHIPFLIALSANSPVWREKITAYASNRVLKASSKYCHVTKRGVLYKNRYKEITFNRGGKKKPPTLELRIFDSTIPEYVAAALCVCRAVALRMQVRSRSMNRSTHANYLKAREQAAKAGPKAKLVWSNHRMSVADYVDLFFRKYSDELHQMDIPDEVIRIFKYLKKGWNLAEVTRAAAEKCRKKHLPTWQRQFAKKYSLAIQELLNGNSFEQFARRLGVKLPSIDRVWLGRKESRW